MNELNSQTLFRFVSLRNPDISDENEKEVRFIYPSEDAKKGTFYSVVPEPGSSVSVMSKLRDAAASFKALSRDELMEVDSKLFNFSQWLVRNRSTYSLEELDKAITGVSSLKEDGVLWDNLFYQFITEADFYAKETVIHMLKANHVVANYEKAMSSVDKEAAIKAIVYATVLLPDDLFKNESDTTNVEKSAKSSVKTYRLPETLVADIAAQDLRDLQNVQEEVNELHLTYQSDYEKEYKAALKKYEEDNKASIDAYNDEVAAAEKEWCASRGEKTYDPQNVDPCDKPAEVKPLQLPDFVFSFKDEIDPKTIQTELSAEAFETLNRLKPIERIKTFEDAKKVLTKEEGRLTSELFDNTTFYKKSVSVKGTIIPVAKTTVKPSDVDYRGGFCSQVRINPRTGEIFWRFFADIESSADSISPVSSVSTKIYQSDGTLIVENNDYIILGSGSDLVRIGLSAGISSPITTPSGASLRLDSTVTFAHGKTISFDGLLRPDTCGMGVSGDSNTNPTPVEDDNFIPSGYGVRQLGIADYRKVEQNIHCYLEGEVSHIENVMAREYKEKSTRRLRASENTRSTSSETEKERLSDTTSTDRYEMQNEVSQVLTETEDFSASTTFNMGKRGKLYFNLGASANYATHTSSEESINQAMTEAQEVTSRAMDRVVQRVKEERITKIIEEYEENNKHGFDNRKGNKHVVGVYRWVDKVYKNQIYNYGRRLMYEFSIPQPSKLHRLAMTEGGSGENLELNEPIDPRTVVIGGQLISNASKINASNYQKLAATYNAAVPAQPEQFVKVGKEFYEKFTDQGVDSRLRNGSSFDVEIPEGYHTTYAFLKLAFMYEGGNNSSQMILNYGNRNKKFNNTYSHNTFQEANSVDAFTEVFPVSLVAQDIEPLAINVVLTCQLSDEAYEAWQLEVFDAIMKAYEDKMAEYLALKGQEVEKAEELKKSNPLFYRQIEQTVLRKNCLSYLMDQAPSATNTYGKKMYTGDAFENHEVSVTESMNNYASFAQFLEQAFEWELMSYSFYPFYWANRNEWSDLYAYENDDPLFRSFMQAGLARVVLTVRPGFEEAVLHYMATGSIWNGGELPVLEDPLYLSVVDELKKPLGVKEGKAWKTQVPTSLTILQADSLGLKVDEALPCNCEDVEDFIESDQDKCSTRITNDPSVFEELQVGDEATSTSTTTTTE